MITTTIVIIVALAIWLSGFYFYSPKIEKVLNPQPDRPTPAVMFRDGVDFYPAKPTILFGDHWAAISGGAPLANGVVGLQWGFIPLAIWLWCGSVFCGAVHDYSVLYMSVRRRGDSIGRLATDVLGPVGGKIFTFYAWITVVIMNAIFIIFLGKIFSGTPVVVIPSWFGFMVSGPLIGWLVYKRGVRVSIATIIAIIWIFITLWLGFLFPIKAPYWVWWLAWGIYPMISASIPAWWMIEPRNYSNFVMMAIGVALLFISALIGWYPVRFPLVRAFYSEIHGPMLPLLVVVVSCGAMSGLHAVWCSGYTSKRIANELHTRLIGYGLFPTIVRRGGFLLESLTASSTMLCCLVLSWDEFFPLFKKHWMAAASTGYARIVGGVTGIPSEVLYAWCMFWLSCFIVTTMDGGNRAARILIVDLYSMIRPVKRAAAARWAGSIVSMLCALAISVTGTWLVLYPMFGATMLMVGALSLGVIVVWLKLTSRRLFYHGWLWVFILSFCFATFIWNIYYYSALKFNPILCALAVVLLVLVTYLAYITIKRFKTLTKEEIEKWTAEEAWPKKEATSTTS